MRVVAFICLALLLAAQALFGESIKAFSSPEELLKNSGIEFGKADLSSGITEIKPALMPKSGGIKFYTVMQFLGGGDFKLIPFICRDSKYLLLTEQNAKEFFAPIIDRKEALDYYFFLRKDLGGALDKVQVYVMNKDAYSPDQAREKFSGCDATGFATENNYPVTEIREIKDGFELDLIVFNPMGTIFFARKIVHVLKDGTIKDVDFKILKELGSGPVF